MRSSTLTYYLLGKVVAPGDTTEKFLLKLPEGTLGKTWSLAIGRGLNATGGR